MVNEATILSYATFDFVEMSLDQGSSSGKPSNVLKTVKHHWRVDKNIGKGTGQSFLTKSSEAEGSNDLGSSPTKSESNCSHQRDKQKMVCLTVSESDRFNEMNGDESNDDDSEAPEKELKEDTSVNVRANGRSKFRRSITLHRVSITKAQSNYLEALLEADAESDAAQYNLVHPQPNNPGVPATVCEGSIQNNKSLRGEIWRSNCASLSRHIKSKEEDHEAEIQHRNNEVWDKTSDSKLVSYFKKLNFISTPDQEAKKSESDKGEVEKDDVDLPEIQFSILGTSAQDVSAQPHILSPCLMDTLRLHMPYAIQEDNFWLKYSLVRDGASMDTLLSKVHSSSSTILAIETTSGEVFGSFTSTPWHQNGNHYYGSGQSFLWRMNQSLLTECDNLLDQAKLESDIEVFKWSGANRNVQLSNKEKLILGGGVADALIEKKFGMAEGEVMFGEEANMNETEWDLGICLNSDLSTGTSGKCVTFGSPGLSKIGGSFDVKNVEVWTMTPMMDVIQAEKLEVGRQFVFSNIASGSTPRITSSLKCQVSRAA